MNVAEGILDSLYHVWLSCGRCVYKRTVRFQDVVISRGIVSTAQEGLSKALLIEMRVRWRGDWREETCESGESAGRERVGQCTCVGVSCKDVANTER